MRRLSAAIGRPVTFALLQVDAAPDLWRELLDASLARRSTRAPTCGPRWPGRPTGLLSGHFTTYCLLDADPRLPGAQGPRPLARRAGRRPARPRACAPRSVVGARRRRRRRGWSRPSDHLRARRPPDYEPGPGAVAGRGSPPPAVGPARGVPTTPCSRTTAAGLLYLPILNYSDGRLDPAREMLLHPRRGRRPGRRRRPLRRSSATPRMPTFMLTHWTRDRTRGERLPLEWVVKKQTHDTAGSTA